VSDDWDGPYAGDRAQAEKELEEGANEITYRGSTFFIDDNDRGWTYSMDRRQFASLEEVLDYIDAESTLDQVAKAAKRSK
jgi:hypothetical protein